MEVVNRDNLMEHIVNAQLKYLNKTISDVKADNHWYMENSLTREQYNEWKKYSLELIRKILGYKEVNEIVVKEFDFIDLMYGLNVKEE